MGRRRRSDAAGRAAPWIAGLLALVVLGLGGWLAYRSWLWAPYRAAREAALAGRHDEALDLSRDARPGPPWAELRGLVLLRSGRAAEAATELGRARDAGAAGNAGERALPAEDLAAELLALGKEHELGVLVEYLEATQDAPLSPVLQAHAGLADHAAGRLDAARERYASALRSGSLSAGWHERVEALARRAETEQRTGRIVVLETEDGTPLGWRRPGAGRLEASEELASLLGGASPSALPGLSEADLDGRVVLTLDPLVQRMAERLFDREEGAFVALDVATGAVLAAAGTPVEGGGAAPAFTPVHGPGSTLKLVTAGLYLDSSEPLDAVLPHDCRGNDFVLEGEILYDWAVHGEVPDLERALATSCNTVFIKMGLRLGADRLRAGLAPLGFSASEGPGATGPGPFPAARMPRGPLTGTRLARTAIGLDETRMSALHGAVLAATIAREGLAPPAHVVARRLTIAGDVLDSAPTAQPRVFGAATAARLAEGMVAVVEEADGTGRGVRDVGVTVAVKTGTTGGDGGPLNAAFVGFIPAERPRLAFGLFTTGSGRSLDVSRRVLGPFLEDLWVELSRRGVSG